MQTYSLLAISTVWVILTTIIIMGKIMLNNNILATACSSSQSWVIWNTWSLELASIVPTAWLPPCAFSYNTPNCRHQLSSHSWSCLLRKLLLTFPSLLLHTEDHHIGHRLWSDQILRFIIVDAFSKTIQSVQLWVPCELYIRNYRVRFQLCYPPHTTVKCTK